MMNVFLNCKKRVPLLGQEMFFVKKGMRQAGMTLIEIIIVVALLATLLAYLAREYSKTSDEAKVDQSKIAMSMVQQGLDMYRIHVGRYPDNLQALLENPDGSKKWRGPYTEANKLLDPWGHEFSYEKVGRSFKMTSSGIDEEMGTGDDISFPENDAGESSSSSNE